MKLIRDHRDLVVYASAMDTAMRVYGLSCSFPQEERYSLTSQIRRSSRSVCANVAEGWQKRRYAPAFTAKLLDAAGEADETRVWIEFAGRCGFLVESEVAELDAAYNAIIGRLIRMATRPQDWRVR